MKTTTLKQKLQKFLMILFSICIIALLYTYIYATYLIFDYIIKESVLDIMTNIIFFVVIGSCEIIVYSLIERLLIEYMDFFFKDDKRFLKKSKYSIK